MRVWWSGAAFALLADLELRRASGGARSLDWALAELRRRFGPFDRNWKAREVVDALDQVSGGRVFGDLYRRWLPSDRFPDLTDAYRRLGIEVVDDTGLHLSDDPRATALRAALLGRRSGGDQATGRRGPAVGCDPGETPVCPGQTLAREDPNP
jgi:predicted metalloprotease with PDZ domain